MSATTRLSAARLNRLFLAGELSATEIVDAFLSRIGQVEPQVRAFITVTAAEARERAQRLDSRRKADGRDLGPLAGVPVAVKDNIVTQGIPTTCGSRILEGFVPPYDATVISRLQGAGAILIGKTNMDEFAMGSSTENSGFFPTRNPWDLERVPGGSSGGSAAAVAADECAVALGSDTGGSIRQPAAFCGVVGLKPTYGAVSRFGLVAFASSLDQIGPIAHDVADAALLFSVIAGHDRRDSTSAPNADRVAQFQPGPDTSLAGVRVGVPREFFAAGLDDGVRRAVEAAIQHLGSLGAEVREVSLPHVEYALDAYYVIAPAEASSNLARYDGVRYGYRSPGAESLLDMYLRTRRDGFGPEVKRRIMIGTYALSAGYYDAYYKKAQQVRTLVVRDFQQAFAEVDVLATPTTPTPAFRIGEKTDDPLAMYLADVYTIPVNLAGLPALSLPCGRVDGLPVGLQLIGRHFEEPLLFRVAHAFEKTTTHGQARPPLDG
ncbi:Asp-tRNA(Asn)/Glu-tRNA(Gln) amidotransferase subunit GatA [Caldinitratiruptor microaerophilus]|uniref:Glutamyl-tRNA(Gln) amidotransferase subunit A n=1 Tax=Caldinitratiruptor microaerophilus TaxID=671077 RepID=A0AA35G9A4_9FIRM|nr:Asp-tRNA(Asn)/Glu-tRNA(Gln) amidotransferase subunit GatA [Caldinitratiruptor microaerophilus]BDG61248.1 aspartyl/glutamyl-tRNA amidotransferase subunit A [Caldinitratiruptor microaerophilus]